jgi:PD-(D/E)XK nuclease superfamily
MNLPAADTYSRPGRPPNQSGKQPAPNSHRKPQPNAPGRLTVHHQAQTRTHLRISGCQIALLMNFNAVVLKDDLHRYVA